MRLGLICVGRLKTGPERELYARYASRIASLRRIGLEGLDLREIDESKSKSPAERKAREAQELLAQAPSLSVSVLARRLGRSDSAIHRAVRRLRESGRLRRVGPDKGGSWQVVE